MNTALKTGLSEDGKTFVVSQSYRMFSGQSDAAQYVYRKVPCRDGQAVWLYPGNSDTPGENVYFHDPADVGSQGFGGSTLDFKLEDGSVYRAKGPWHSNTEAMFKQTGVDLRATHRTYGVVAKRRICQPHRPGTSYNSSEYVFEEVLCGDHSPQIGAFSRIEDLAKCYANELQVPVAYYSESKGGSSCGWEFPNSDKDQNDWRKWDEYIKEHSQSAGVQP